MMGEKVRQMAGACEDKVIDLIGSGYNKRVLPYAWLALISGLAGIKVEVEEPEPIPQRLIKDPSLVETSKVVDEVKKSLKDHWKCLR